MNFIRKLGWLMRRRRKERELQEELQFHLDEEAEQREAEGIAPEDARRAARRDLGNLTLVQENTREVWGWTLLEQFGQDVRYAVRTMASNRLFSMLAIMSLALGIGANTAIYSFLDAVLLRPLPVEDPQSLVVLNWRMKFPYSQNAFGPNGARTVMYAMSGTTYPDPDLGMTGGIFPFPVLDLLQKSDSVFSSLFAYFPVRDLNAVIQGQAELAGGVYVTGEYFTGLGVSPAAGRLIVADDDRAGVPPVAVVSYSYSQRRFGDVSSAVGQRILMNNVPFTIVGVTPPAFFGVDATAAPNFYVPMQTKPVLDSGDAATNARRFLDQNYYWIRMMGRLRPGVTLVGAQSALALPFHQWMENTARNDDQRAFLPELLLQEGASGPDPLRRRYSRPLYVLMMLVGMILAVACANIANLLLARASARRREIAVRLSVGAGRLRIIRQLLTESVVLASLGGILGVLFASWCIRVLTLLLGNNPAALPPRADLNWHVLGVAAALSLLTGLLFGLAPAIQATRISVLPALKDIRPGRGPSRIGVGLGDGLVVFQISMSLLTLVAAGLFVGTLSNLNSVQLGFNAENVLLFQVNGGQSAYKGREMASLYEGLWERFRAIPGIRSVSLSHEPLIRAGTGMPISVDDKPVNSRLLFIGPAFFTTMQIPMVLGREFDERDRSSSRTVAVISELFAKTAFGNENPIGRLVTMAGDKREMEIVGVAKDARYSGLRAPIPPVLYVPFNQGSFTFIDRMTFALRTAGNDPLGYANTVRETVRDMDTGVPVANITTQSDLIDQTISDQIMFARLCTAFAILSLVIACVGLYGTVKYNVARRTNEIGIRVALGAQRGRVIWTMLRKIIVSAFAGLAIGLPLALLGSRYVESFLFGMKPYDPLTIVTAVVILLISAIAAAFFPAHRASRIDPTVALRHE